jgi:hypothetical protein
MLALGPKSWQLQVSPAGQSADVLQPHSRRGEVCKQTPPLFLPAHSPSFAQAQAPSALHVVPSASAWPQSEVVLHSAQKHASEPGFDGFGRHAGEAAPTDLGSALHTDSQSKLSHFVPSQYSSIVSDRHLASPGVQAFTGAAVAAVRACLHVPATVGLADLQCAVGCALFFSRCTLAAFALGAAARFAAGSALFQPEGLAKVVAARQLPAAVVFAGLERLVAAAFRLAARALAGIVSRLGQLWVVPDRARDPRFAADLARAIAARFARFDARRPALTIATKLAFDRVAVARGRAGFGTKDAVGVDAKALGGQRRVGDAQGGAAGLAVFGVAFAAAIAGGRALVGWHADRLFVELAADLAFGGVAAIIVRALGQRGLRGTTDLFGRSQRGANAGVAWQCRSSRPLCKSADSCGRWCRFFHLRQSRNRAGRWRYRSLGRYRSFWDRYRRRSLRARQDRVWSDRWDCCRLKSNMTRL